MRLFTIVVNGKATLEGVEYSDASVALRTIPVGTAKAVSCSHETGLSNISRYHAGTVTFPDTFLDGGTP